MINLLEIFTETYNFCKKNNKSESHMTRIKYKAPDIFNTLKKLISNSCYFSRFTDLINGKYLNEIHLSLEGFSFYDLLYKKLLSVYLDLTDNKTLEKIAGDSMFVRNINGCELNGRNPQYYNKPGFKANFIVDELRVPIALTFSDCIDNDSLSMKPLFENMFIEKPVLDAHVKIALFDSAYEGLINNYFLTEECNMETYMGYNKRNSKYDNDATKNATENDKSIYKSRGIVENLIGNIQRVPILINNYEKTMKSYRGLLMFHLCVMLAKKINMIHEEKLHNKIKKGREISIKKQKEEQRKKKLLKVQQKIKKDEENKIKKNKRDDECEKINDNIKKLILKTTNANNDIQQILKKSHTKYIMNKLIERNIKDRKYVRKTESQKYEKKVNYVAIEDYQNIITNLIKVINDDIKDAENEYNICKDKIITEISNDLLHNNIYEILSYNFAKKKLKMIHIKASAFKEENIIKIMNEYDWQQKITKIMQKITTNTLLNAIT